MMADHSSENSRLALYLVALFTAMLVGSAAYIIWFHHAG